MKNKKIMNWIFCALIWGGTAFPVYGNETPEEIPEAPILTQVESIVFDATMFPDANFRKKLETVLSKSEGDLLTQEELDRVTSLELSSNKIQSLQGIGYFRNLKRLICSNNTIGALDLSLNSALEELNCEFNSIGSLDFSNNPNLKKIRCSNNQLTSLNVGHLVDLATFYCLNNNIKMLDVSKNLALVILNCGQNQMLKLTLTPSLKELYCYQNQLIALDLTNLRVLEFLNCSYNQLINLDLVANSVLKECIATSNQITSLDLTNSIALEKVMCDQNNLTVLDVSKNQNLKTLYCDQNQLTSLNVGGNVLLEILECSNNELTQLELGDNSNLKYVGCADNFLTCLDLPPLAVLQGFNGYSQKAIHRQVDRNQPQVDLDAISLQMDPDRIRDVQGATFNRESRQFVDLKEGIPIEYTYVCSNESLIHVKIELDFFGAIKKLDVSSATIRAIQNSYVYTGAAIVPEPKVLWEEKELKKGTDFQVAVRDNVNAGTAELEIQGIGAYRGNQKINFEITPRSIQEAQISGIASSYLYTGKPIQPVPVVKYGTVLLEAGKDYTLSYAANTNVGTATVTITGKGNYTGVKKVTFQINKAVTVQKVQMHRLYNPNSGEHFYTANTKEKNDLVKLGWKYEGVGWNAPNKSNTPVYRLYNPNAGDHHYTLNLAEKNNLVKVGWNYEGIGWYSDDSKGVPLYRQYNPNAKAGSHNYTTDKKEHDHLVSIGWRNENIGWYGMK